MSTSSDPRPAAPAPPAGHDWVGLVTSPLPVGVATDWAVLPSCGAVVLFSGTARDHAPGRPEVSRLAYEAYEQPALERMSRLVAIARDRWPVLGRVAVLHRTGVVPVGESAVVVVASAPHRAEAFEAARFLIDAVKETVPIWKHETWSGGEAWGADARPVVEPESMSPETWSSAGA